MGKRRAVITGLGPISAIGIGKDAFLDSLLQKRSGIQKLDYFSTDKCRAKCAGQVHGFDPTHFFSAKRLKRLDGYARFAVASAILAVRDSGLSWPDGEPQLRYGVSFGTALGGITGAEEQHTKFLQEGPGSVNKSLALMVFGGSAHSNIAIEFGFRGPGTTNSNSCASGNVALGEALRFIQNDQADVMIAGAAEAPLSPLTFSAFDFIKTMSQQTPDIACRPFDRNRDGFVMGEGGASLVVEEYEHAKARGAKIYAEVLGYSLNNDAYHMTSSLPDAEATIRAMRHALEDAEINSDQIDYINAHASSTQMNDANEAVAIRALFGGDSKVPISGTKAYTAHPLGATGAMESVACCLAMNEGFIPPTLNFETPDESSNLNIIHGDCQDANLRYTMNNAFGFGGINSSVILGLPA